jgi:hypothetical protein
VICCDLTVQIICFGIKVTATALCIFVTNYKWLSVGLTACMLLLAISLILWVSTGFIQHTRG